jgi:hypothetical protein
LPGAKKFPQLAVRYHVPFKLSEGAGDMEEHAAAGVVVSIAC